MSTSFPVKKNMVSGVFVGRLCDALKEYMEVLVVAPDSADSLPVVPQVEVFKYSFRRYQTLAHTAGGIPAQLKNNKWLFLHVPVFLASYFFLSVKKAKKSHVIVANWAISGFVGALVKYVARVPLITVLRGEDVKLQNTKNRILDAAVKHSDTVVVVSEEMKKALVVAYPAYAKKICFIANGVGSFKAAAKPYSKGIKLIFVGSLIARKNVEFILRDLALLIHVDFIFHVLGEGEQLTHLENLALELKLDKKVRFYGYVEPDQVCETLSGADYYVSASLHEGRPNSVVEAMAMGCIPILSDISGHRELVKGISDELLFSVVAPGSLAKALKRVAEVDRVSGDLQCKVRNFAQDNFYSWDDCAGQYAQLIESVMESR